MADNATNATNITNSTNSTAPQTSETQAAQTSTSQAQEPKPKEAWQIEADQRTKDLTDKLEAGMSELFSSDKYTDYLKTMSKFHNYSSRNIMLIKQQMPGATRIASFKSWKENHNRQVKKGAESLRIYAPIGKKEPETKLFEKIDPATGKPMLSKDGNVIMEELTALTSNIRFKLVPVFDVSQTYGEPLPQLAEDLTGNVAHYEAFLDTLKSVSPLPIVFEPLKSEQDGYCRFGEHIGIREGMSEIQTVSAIVHEITHARLHDKNNLLPDDKPKSKDVKEIEAESVSYVVCQKYGIETGDNSFGYLASWGSHDMKEIKASLDTIRKEASGLIGAIDDKFVAICKERGIDLSQSEQAQPAPAAEIPQTPAEQAEPTFTTETRTENIAGVDFELQEVVPEAIETVQQTAAEHDPIHEFTSDYYQYILDAYRNGVPRDSPAQIENDILGLADIIRNGKTENFREAIERAGINSGTQEKAAALLQRLDELSPQTATAEHTVPLSEPAEVLPDPTISIAEQHEYGYTSAELLPLNMDRAVELYNQDITVFLLYPDNTEAMAFDVDEIQAHDGIFGIEVEDWQNSNEYQVLAAQSADELGQTADTPPQPPPPTETAAKELPPSEPPAEPAEEPHEIPKSEIPIYKESLSFARENGELDIYRQNKRLNVECGEAIDNAIRENSTPAKYGQYVDSKQAAKDVIAEYGAERVALVLASNIKDAEWDGRFSNATKAWAKEADVQGKPDVYLQCHRSILDGFVGKFREAVKEIENTPQAQVTDPAADKSEKADTKISKEKPSLMDTLKAGEEKSKREFGNVSKPGIDSPAKSTKNKTGEEL